MTAKNPIQALGAAALYLTSQYNTRVKIRTVMDEVLSDGQLKLTCGKCKDICSCLPCASLNEALADYLLEFQGSELDLEASAYERHQNVRRSVAERFDHDQERYELFKRFVAKLWWTAQANLPSNER